MTAQNTGLIGHPVSHSLSPLIHGYWRTQYNVAGEYGLHDIAPEHFATDIEKLKKTPLRGLNVTVPHKEKIVPFLNSIDETAKTIGAVNTLVNEQGEWRGTNTDAFGFMEHLKAEIADWEPVIQQCVVVGAGGAARAILYALKEAGAARITLLNRTREKAEQLAREFRTECAAMEEAAEYLKTATLLVNTTSAGMKQNPPLLLPMLQLPPDAVVYDIVYAPLITPLLAEAHALNLATIDGLGMLLYQAQGAFEQWHGVRPAVTPELRALCLEALA